MSTVHAPHSPRSHPGLVPVRPSPSLMASMSVVRGSTAIRRRLPFTCKTRSTRRPASATGEPLATRGAAATAAAVVTPAPTDVMNRRRDIPRFMRASRGRVGARPFDLRGGDVVGGGTMPRRNEPSLGSTVDCSMEQQAVKLPGPDPALRGTATAGVPITYFAASIMMRDPARIALTDTGRVDGQHGPSPSLSRTSVGPVGSRPHRRRWPARVEGQRNLRLASSRCRRVAASPAFGSAALSSVSSAFSSPRKSARTSSGVGVILADTRSSQARCRLRRYGSTLTLAAPSSDQIPLRTSVRNSVGW